MIDPKHDFNAPIAKTTAEIAKVLIHELSSNADLLVIDAKTPEEEKLKDEQATDFAIRFMRIISSTDIPADYASYSIEKIQVILSQLKKYVDGMVDQTKREILSRYIGARSPRTGTFTYDVATLGEFMMALDRIRKETGNNDDDFFVKETLPETMEATSPDPVVDPTADGSRGVVNAETQTPVEPEEDADTSK